MDDARKVLSVMDPRERRTSKTDVEEDEMWKAAKARRALFGVLPIIALVLGYQEVFMSQATADGGVKNVVLVHGGFVDGSGWQGVYDTLKKDGYTVSIVQNPTI